MPNEKLVASYRFEGACFFVIKYNGEHAPCGVIPSEQDYRDEGSCEADAQLIGGS